MPPTIPSQANAPGESRGRGNCEAAADGRANAQICPSGMQGVRGTQPTFVAVDFLGDGDVSGILGALNDGF